MHQFKKLDPDEYNFTSLDLGVDHTGVTHWRGGHHARTFSIESVKATPESIKPVYMARTIIASLETQWDNLPYALLLEDYGYGSKFFNVLVSEIFGIVKNYCHNEKIPFIPIPPNVIKKSVTGNGRAGKDDVKLSIKSRGYKITSSHEADSIAVFLTYKDVWPNPGDGVIKRSIIL